MRGAPLALVCLLVAGCADAETVGTKQARFEVERLVGGLDHPWSLAFLPDGDMLITERSGQLRRVNDGRLMPEAIAGVPEVAARGQGGLLDVVTAPDVEQSGLVYLSYAALRDGRPTTHVARGRLDGMVLRDVEVIFASNGVGSGAKHFGGRLAFARDGRLIVTHGELGRRDNAQDRSSHAGSVLRLEPNGSLPADNPFVSSGIGEPGIAPEIFSYGHRNPQGLAIHPETGAIWLHEHGPQGGDEVNIVMPGANYGWPVVSYGGEYGSGAQVGEGKSKPGIVEPLHYWNPSIAPSGMAFYAGDAIPEWQGDLLVGALKYRMLVRLELDGDKVVDEERMLEGAIGRIRDVRVGPDGLVYLLNDEGRSMGGVFRLRPLK